MLTLPAGLSAHTLLRTTSLTFCHAITKKNGEVLRGTVHDRDITIPSGTYAGTYRARTAVFASSVRSNSDGAVSNLEAEGALRVDASVDDLTVADIQAGLYHQAPAVLLLVNWRNPADGVKIVAGGTLGEFYRDSDGRYRTEVRGLTQALTQQLLQTYAERCNVRKFGDSRCRFDVASVTRTATVTAVTDRKNFTATLDAGPDPVNATYYDGAELLFTSGANEDFVREVKTAVVAGSDVTIALWDEVPADIEIGDTFELPPGCDRRYETCRDVHDNLVNFRGYGIFAVGRDRLMRGPK